MSAVRYLGIVVIGLTLTACGRPESASRGLADRGDGLTLATRGEASLAARPVMLRPNYAVQDVRVAVSSDLRASEANVFYPLADIVWRGEPAGNRHQQVRKIFFDALNSATGNMTTGPGVIVDVNVSRFHSVTEKTRYTVGGVHSLRFTMTVRDAVTGAIVEGPREVVADTPAVGGSRAVAEDNAGRTQRVVIVERLVEVFKRELSQPVGYAALPTEPAPVLVAN